MRMLKYWVEDTPIPKNKESDVWWIQEALSDSFDITNHQCYEMWLRFSEDSGESWFPVPRNDPEFIYKALVTNG